MLKKTLALAVASMFIAPASFAVVLDGDNSVVSSSAGKFKDWSASFFSLASVENMKPRKEAPGERQIESYNYLSLNYKVDSVTRVSLRLPFFAKSDGYNSYGDKKTSEASLGDIHFVYSNYDLGYIGDVDLSGKAKIYLPTGTVSQSKKMITMVRFEGYADYAISRSTSVAYVVKPDIYWQSQTASLNDTTPMNDYGSYVTDPRSTNQQFGLEHYIQFQWDINQMFSVTTKTGFDEGWYHSSAAEELEGSHRTSLRLGANLWIRPTRSVSFTLGVGNETRLTGRSDGKDIAIGEPQNTQYTLMTNAYLF